MLDQIRNQIRRIPKGSVMTYGEVAKAAGFEGAARQVAWALRNANIDLPWHRVVGAGLRIRLPGEAGLEQRLRLEMEGWSVASGKLLEKNLDSKLKPARATRRKNRTEAG